MHEGERIRRNVPLAGCHLQHPEQITRFGRAPGPYASLGFANAQVMAAAVEKAETLDREGVLAQLHGVTVETLLGPVAFDENGENTTAPMYLYIVKDGKFELIKQ